MGETFPLSDPRAPSFQGGEIVGGKYRLERELGRGAMGEVWAASHVTLGQRVAIKLIAPEHARSPEARARFSTEAKAAARLKSRYAVQVYDDGETAEGTPYIVMEYLDGETLEARVARERELPLVDAVRITAQVARALSRAHAVGIVHRDLKPSNIFLTRNDEDELGWVAKVLDFGIAKLEGASFGRTQTGTLLGTALFMSPEQVQAAHAVDARSDLYSLGICFYNMLTGQLAFDRGSFAEILLAICTAPLPKLTNGARTVPASVQAWFERCCARLPQDRFQSADELLEALQFAVGSGVVILSRGAVPHDQRGPFGTIKGHSPPLSPHTQALDSIDSGKYSVPLPQSTQLMPPTARSAEAYVPVTAPDVAHGDVAAQVLTVPGLPSPRALRMRLISIGIVASAAVLLLVALVLRGFGGTKAAQPSASTSSLPPPAPPAATAATEPVAPPPRPPAAPSDAPPSEILPAPEPAPERPALGVPQAAPKAPAAPARPARSAPASAAPESKTATKPSSAKPKSSFKPTDLGF